MHRGDDVRHEAPLIQFDIGLQQQGGELRIWVRNPAPPPREQDAAHDGAGHAQHSIGQRLAYAYGGDARMAGRWDEGYYQAELRVPLDGEPPK